MATLKKKRPLKFPDPGGTKGKDELVMIDAERMLTIYNQDHPDLKQAQRVTPKIVEHSVGRARDAGWASTAHLKDAMTGHTSGLLLIKPQQTTVNVSMAIIATSDSEEPVPKPRRVFKG